MSNIIEYVMDFSIPDEMRKMTEEEHKKYFGSLTDTQYGIYNKEKHTILAILYKKRPMLIGKWASVDTSLIAVERQMKKMLPSFEKTGKNQRTLEGETVKSFCFQYKAQDIMQKGEYVLCRLKKFDCSFEMICQEEYLDYANQKLEELLSSVKVK